MSRMQRRVLAAVGILSLVMALVVLVVAGRDAGSDGVLASNGKSTTSDSDVGDDAAPDRTAGGEASPPGGLAPVRGGTALPPTTAAPATTASTEPPPSTTATLPPALDGKGSAFGPPPDTSTRAAPTGDCRTLASAGWSAQDCGTVNTTSGPITWLIESRSKGWRATLLKPSGVGQWSPYLYAGDDAGARWSEIKARVAEGPTGSTDQMVGFGFRAKSGGLLSADLVRQGQVAVHLELAKGAARISRGQLDTWAAQTDGTYLHQVIRWSADAWRVVDRESISAALVPPSHL